MPEIFFLLLQILRRPRVPGLIVLVLAAGSFLALLLFTVLDAFLWQDGGYRAPDELVQILSQRKGQTPRRELPAGTFLFLREQSGSFTALAGIRPSTTSLDQAGRVEALATKLVTASFLDALGLVPQFGRGFLASEEAPGSSRVVLLSQTFWTERFNRDPAAVGARLLLDGQEHVVVGIMPPVPAEYEATMLWRPFTFGAREKRDFTFQELRVIARLRPEVPLAAAQQELARLSAALVAQQPAQAEGWTAHLTGWRTEYAAPIRPVLGLLIGAGALSAMLAGLNASGLALARFAARQREMAVRYALGASRRAVVGPLVGEGALLALLGAGLGCVLVLPALVGLRRFTAETFLPAVTIELGGRTVGVAAALAGFYVLLLVSETTRRASQPTWTDFLKQSVLADRRVRRFQCLLIVVQLAAGFALAANATLLIEGWRRLRHTDVGFVTEGLALASIRTPAGRYATPAKQAAFAESVRAQVARLPGVQSAAVTVTAALSRFFPIPFLVHGAPAKTLGELPVAGYAAVSPDYFATMGIRLAAGRSFTDGDRAGAPRVAIINETLARNYFPGKDPLNQWLYPTVDVREWRRVVGVVADVAQESLTAPPLPQIYEPFAQFPSDTFTLVFRAQGGRPLPAWPVLRGAIAAVDPAQPLGPVRTFASLLDRLTIRQRSAALALLVAAGFSLALATAGFGSLMALTTWQRHREFGLRLALGATPRVLVGLVLRQGLRLAAAGLALGTIGAFALGQAATAAVPGVATLGITPFAAAAGLLCLSTLTACAVPAWLATRVDPAQALRAE